MLRQCCRFPFEVVVVDYGCPQHTFEWCQSLDLHRLLTLRVLDNVDEFNRSRARNCGASVATGRMLAFVDADMLMDETWLEKATELLRSGQAGSSVVAEDWRRGWDRGGSWVVLADLFHAVHGYDEQIQGWGAEDSDVHERCRQAAPQAKFARSLLTPIKHGHDERVQFHRQKCIGSSNRENREYLAQRSGVVNPDGFGQGDFETFRGSGDANPPVTWVPRRRIVRGIRKPGSAALAAVRIE